jgi:transposase
MMISDEMRVRIRRLFFGEHWKVGTIAEQLGVHHETVRRAIDVDRLVARGNARPSDLDPFLDFIREQLKRYPKLTGTRVHEMLSARGYRGSVSQVRRRIRQLSLRPTPLSEAYFRLVTLPGEQAQVDWAHLGSIRVDLYERPLFALVMVLSWSRAVHAYFSLDQKFPSVLRGHVEAFSTFHGVPREILYDYVARHIIVVMCPLALCGWGRGPPVFVSCWPGFRAHNG